MQSLEEAEAFNRDYKKWDDYNEALLTSLFTNDTPASLCRWSVSLGVIPFQRNLYALEKKFDYLQSETARCKTTASRSSCRADSHLPD